MKSIKNDIEYKQEKLEWENIFLRLRRMTITKGWTNELDEIEVLQTNIEKKLVLLYDQRSG